MGVGRGLRGHLVQRTSGTSTLERFLPWVKYDGSDMPPIPVGDGDHCCAAGGAAPPGCKVGGKGSGGSAEGRGRPCATATTAAAGKVSARSPPRRTAQPVTPTGIPRTFWQQSTRYMALTNSGPLSAPRSPATRSHTSCRTHHHAQPGRHPTHPGKGLWVVMWGQEVVREPRKVGGRGEDLELLPCQA